MSKDNKKIFISYRRSASQYFARLVFNHLDDAGYDTFLDIKSINAGEFERIIKGQIKAREHFLAILAPGSLERLENPDDLLRQELELALDLGRNIIPVFHNRFDFDIHGEMLTGKLVKLKALNGLSVYDSKHFDTVMKDLCENYLENPVYIDIVETSAEEETEAQEAIAEARETERPTEAELNAEEYFNKGLEASTPEEKIQYYTLAIEKKPDYVWAYNNRGNAYNALNKYDLAFSDLNKAIELYPEYPFAYNNRGNTYNNHKIQQYERAIEDYNKSIKFDPQYALAYTNRGIAFDRLKKYESAMNDHTMAIQLNQKNSIAFAYNNRAYVQNLMGKHDAALTDIKKALHIGGNSSVFNTTKAVILHDIGKLADAIIWYDKALALDSGPRFEPVKKWRKQALAGQEREPKEYIEPDT